jgi:carbon storage regulator CsrA
MLVLSRLEGESVSVPEVQLAIRLLKISGGRVRLGIEAPGHVRVVRTEVLSSALKTATSSPSTLRGADVRLQLETARRVLAQAETHYQQGDIALAEAALNDLRQSLVSTNRVAEPSASYESSALLRTEEKLQVMVLGDEVRVADILGELVTCDEIEVRSAENPQEALQLMEESSVELILLDPALSSEVVEHLLTQLRNRHAQHIPPIYCVTDWTTDDVALPECETIG